MEIEILKKETNEVVNLIANRIIEDLECGESEMLHLESVSSEFYHELDNDDLTISIAEKAEKLLMEKGFDVSINVAQDDDDVMMIEWALQD